MQIVCNGFAKEFGPLQLGQPPVVLHVVLQPKTLVNIERLAIPNGRVSDGYQKHASWSTRCAQLSASQNEIKLAFLLPMSHIISFQVYCNVQHLNRKLD